MWHLFLWERGIISKMLEAAHLNYPAFMLRRIIQEERFTVQKKTQKNKRGMQSQQVAAFSGFSSFSDIYVI